ncbi:MAG: hypothetical protein A2725_01765 [Candidatus Magasanikbacteria bacterium RIFCSPHIGHO2_01_FULL_33_34]|uniref:Dipeptidylpeptidase IV N-terminal domain-containing protein n=1 Tax=Candidatus Magasanikbacteria bacterium RIFCSPHIGHO2_01_FULL_33_34 TaxID=1798671 RepID=A0A1F6LKV2_9BACT|nr:MAG: hypothetical protein A2725_01765 [Candidatus Magasanikbacteria bacterium RIFCSPHIGHO2_01_FULL_33_34]OGH65700.1 MAG: hypothetical protein A3B83_02270 [Candidatus Magasanikbacteria bacterium RIFCSPHIGHO2_02_FULL_33_17]OGH76313.1 MAG: hypothetical protein A3A89_03095 [Candidatus Magasanikbacteria bacterium RIFCSPLOWO2_01_FULL_33_34]OGH81653.1 MAG: hypothetical protein A3F93_01040 [Candidatus Magasanikbacteria bacterium RIFCSPLOWO2_12_FULL_34_7]
MDKKRILMIVGFIIVTLLLGFALYWVFFAEKPSGTITEPGDGTTPTTGIFPPSDTGDITDRGEIAPGVLPPSDTRAGGSFRQGQITKPAKEEKIVDSSILNPSLNNNGDPQFYNKNDGKFYQVLSDGTVRALSDKIFYNVEKVTWSPNDNESIIEYPDGSNIYYNFKTQQQVTLPKYWEDFSFSEEGSKIASKSIGYSPENRWIVTSNPDGSNLQYVAPLGENGSKVDIDWSPTRKIVALSRTGNPLGVDRQEVLLIGQNNENFKSLTVEGRGMQSAWSPTGQQLLYSVYSTESEFKPELWIVNADGDKIDTNRRPLLINTWADKCTFSGDRYVYCGVPVELPVGAGFEPTIADNIQDTIFRIDLQTGSKTSVATDNAHVIDQIFISDDGKKLHFTDKSQDGLFSIDL